MHKLIIEDDEGKTVVVPLIRDEITVGRRDGNTIRLTEQNISRRHARLVRENGALFIEDLGSYNGLKLNGASIAERRELKNGDEILIGDYKLGIRSEAQGQQGKEDAAIPYGSKTAPAAGAPARAAAAPQPAAPAVAAPAPAPVPAGDIDGAPTIPVRTLATQTTNDADQEPPGRLVVVSTLLNGHEFLLDRASLVVGRTSENDIVLDHKSISRHHVKIIRDGSRYIVVDLESANGLRVNGVSEERVELDSGDTIELGHVKLRFVAAGERVDLAVSLRGGSKKKLVLVAVAAAVAASVAIFAMGLGKERPPVSAAGSTASTAPTQPAPPDKAAVPAVGKTASDHLNEAAALLDRQDWDGALAAARQAAQTDPSSARVQELVRQIEADRTGSEQVAILKTQAQVGNLEAARAAATAVPENSRFKRDVPDLLVVAGQNYLQAHLQAAQDQAAAGACAEAQAEATLVLGVAPDNQTAINVIAVCKKATRRAAARAADAEPRPAVAARAARARPAPAPARPTPAQAAAVEDPSVSPPSRPAPVVASTTEGADVHIKTAQESWLRGQYAAAIEASRSALRADPSLMKAYQIIAVCSCSLRDKAGATRAYQRLDTRNRDLVKSMCQKNGITFD